MFYKLSWISDIISGIGDALNWVLDNVLFFLPASPFQAALNGMAQNDFISDVFGYMNYLLPLTEILAILVVWVTAIGVFYLYQVILRWARAIE